MATNITEMSPARVAKFAGILYLFVRILGISGSILRYSLFVPGDATATTNNIISSEFQFRMGFVIELIHLTCFLVLPLPLFYLLKRVNKILASIMVLFVIVSVPIAMLNTLNHYAALTLLSGDVYLSSFTTEQLHTQIMFFLNLYEPGYLIAQIFFGLWLVPLGYLVYQSDDFPNLLGILLIMGGLSQLIGSLTSFLFTNYDTMIVSFLEVFGISELLFCLWLLTKGVKKLS